MAAIKVDPREVQATLRKLIAERRKNEVGGAASPAAPQAERITYLTGIGAEHVAEIVDTFFSDGAKTAEVAEKGYVVVDGYDRRRVVEQEAAHGGAEFVVMAAYEASLLPKFNWNGRDAQNFKVTSAYDASFMPMWKWDRQEYRTVNGVELPTTLSYLLGHGGNLLTIVKDDQWDYTIYKHSSPYGRVAN